MEEGDCYCCCCCGEEANVCRQNTLVQLLRQKKTQLQRLAQCIVAGVLLLVSLVLALLLMFVFGSGYFHHSSDCQHIVHDDGQPSATSAKQQQDKQARNPSALLTAASNRSAEREYLDWEVENGLAHLDGGFQYDSGDLVVPKEGNYWVYLQITYENQENFSCDEDEVVLTHRVLRFQVGYTKDVVLLSSAYTVTCSMKTWRKSLYTAAVFRLKAKDRLRVFATHPELMTVGEHQVFFGAELEPQ
ncbi:lymphotoxin-alpha-like [Centroberyx affinis]|uniref:lymphotoxin-alpha-like n=1 Tax=Centroberyx affinis TaxID=166261 RepID=UPI003A5B9C60